MSTMYYKSPVAIVTGNKDTKGMSILYSKSPVTIVNQQ